MILVSVWRDSSEYIDRYLDQVMRLRSRLPVEVVAAEGDSSDDTFARLKATDFHVLKVEHGGPYYPSLDIPFRWRQLAVVCNVAMTAALRVGSPDEPVVYVESDLIWDTDTMVRLTNHTARFAAVAPLSLRGRQFYDVWGYRKDGVKFRSWPPYHDGLRADRMVRIDSAGSCIALSPTAANIATWSQEDCILGVGRSLYAAGLSLWLDPTLSVQHPVYPAPAAVPA